MTEKDGVWKTIRGRRVFIKNGESLTNAIKNSGKFKKAFDEATKRKGKTATAANPEPPSHAKLRKALENQRKFKKAVDEAITREERELKAKYMAIPEDQRVSAYEHGENWKDLGEKYSLNDQQLKTLHNHLEANIKAWREQGMSNQQILDMVRDRQEIAGDDGLYNLKGIDMENKKTEVLNEYQSYIQNKISTKTKKDYDASLEKINKIPTDGTYDLETGSSKDYSDGYQVTFSMTNMDFDDKTYQDLVEKFKTHDHGTVDAGKFDGYPEISFNVTDLKTAAKLATKYNQISIWDWKNGKIIPTKGTGAYADYKPESVSDKLKSQRKEKK